MHGRKPACSVAQMAGGKLGKVVGLSAAGIGIALLVSKLRGPATPQFSDHPSINGGPGYKPSPNETEAPPTSLAQAGSEPEPKVEPEAEAESQQEANGEPEAVADVAADVATETGPDIEAKAWVDPVDGACPDGYPIKAKLSSGIYHLPGGLSYERTKPDRCYASAEAAEADGLRAAKR